MAYAFFRLRCLEKLYDIFAVVFFSVGADVEGERRRRVDVAAGRCCRVDVLIDVTAGTVLL